MKKYKSINNATAEDERECRIETDPFGSYTGVCAGDDIYDEPVQDVDDL